MLTFSHPALLWFLAGMAVPVCLHLLNQRQKRRVIFPSVRFLERSRQPQDGRRRLTEFLLLLLRMAVVGTAALLLAGPRWIPQVASDETEGVRTAVVLVDVSASMRTGGRWGRALEAVRKALDGLEGWKVAVMPVSTVADEAGGAYFPVTVSRERWKWEEALSVLEPTCLGGAPLLSVKGAVSVLSGGRKRLVIASDFQASEWERGFHVVPPDVELELLDVKDASEMGNWGVADVRCQRLGARRLRVVTTVFNQSSEGGTRELTVSAGGMRHRETVSLASQERTRCIAVFDDVELGQHCEALLSPADVYPSDDRYVFWGDGIPVQNVLLCVDTGQDSIGSVEAAYVRTALESESEEGGRRFAATVAETGILSAAELSHCQAVFFLGGVGGLQDDAVEGVHSLLARGGVVFVTPGQSPGGDLRRLGELGLDFGQFLGLSGQSSSGRSDGVRSVAPESVLAPLYANVSESDMYSFPIRRYARIRASHASRVLLTSLGGSPLLLEFIRGRGRCFLLAFGFSEWWSDFQLTNSFLPMLQELLLSSVPRDFGHRRVSCGAVVRDVATDLPVDTQEPQLHKVGMDYVEVNFDPSESSQRFVDDLDMRDVLRASGDGAEDGAGTVVPDGAVWNIGDLLELCLLGLVLAEAAVSLFFSGRFWRERT